MKIKEMPLQNRPRERLKKYGSEPLNDAELLAIILRTGFPGENAIDMSNRLIAEYGLDKLFECSLEELQKIKGMGPVKAMQIKAISQLVKNQKVAWNEYNKKNIKISCAEDVFNYFHERLKDEKQENFYILMLNTQNNIIGEQLISKGILDASIIHPREVFKPAIKNSAAKIILVHNHPSGDASPSRDDRIVLDKLRSFGEGMGINITDHIIIGKGNYWSNKEKEAR